MTGASIAVDVLNVVAERRSADRSLLLRTAASAVDVFAWSMLGAEDDESQQVAAVGMTPLALEAGFRSDGAAVAVCTAAAASMAVAAVLRRSPMTYHQLAWYALVAIPGVAVRRAEAHISRQLLESDQRAVAARYREARGAGRRSALVGAQEPAIEAIGNAARILWFSAPDERSRAEVHALSSRFTLHKELSRQRARPELTGDGAGLRAERPASLTLADAARELTLRLFTPIVCDQLTIEVRAGDEEATVSSAAVDALVTELDRAPLGSHVTLGLDGPGRVRIRVDGVDRVVRTPDDDRVFLPLWRLDAGAAAVAGATTLVLLPDRPRGGLLDTLRRQAPAAVPLAVLTWLTFRDSRQKRPVSTATVLTTSAACSLLAVRRAPESLIPHGQAGASPGRLALSSLAHILGAYWHRATTVERTASCLALGVGVGLMADRTSWRVALSDALWVAVAAFPASGADDAIQALLDQYNSERRDADVAQLHRNYTDGVLDAAEELRGYASAVRKLAHREDFQACLSSATAAKVDERLATADRKIDELVVGTGTRPSTHSQEES